MEDLNELKNNHNEYIIPGDNDELEDVTNNKSINFSINNNQEKYRKKDLLFSFRF